MKSTNHSQDSAAPAQRPKIGLGPLAKRERNFALMVFLPTLIAVFSVIIIPLLANIWISVKPVTLADLRPATLIVSKRFSDRDSPVLEYRIRNSSIDKTIASSGFTDYLPDALALKLTDPRCSWNKPKLECEIGDIPGRFRDKITIDATVAQPSPDISDQFRSTNAVTFGQSDNVITSFSFTFANFAEIFSASDFINVLVVSFAYTIFGTLGALVLGLAAAQLLRSAFPGRGVLRGLFLFSYVAPVIAVAFTWVILFDPFSGSLNALLIKMNLVDGPVNFFGQRSVPFTVFGMTFNFPLALSMVVAFEAWRYFPLSFLFILARMQAIPEEMYEAAQMDGATPTQQFWYISMPHIIGILAILFLLRFIWTFNKFDDIFLLTGGASGTRTLIVDVYEKAFAISNIGAGAATAVVVFVILLTFSLIFFKFMPKEQ